MGLVGEQIREVEPLAFNAEGGYTAAAETSNTGSVWKPCRRCCNRRGAAHCPPFSQSPSDDAVLPRLTLRMRGTKMEEESATSASAPSTKDNSRRGGDTVVVAAATAAEAAGERGGGRDH